MKCLKSLAAAGMMWAVVMGLGGPAAADDWPQFQHDNNSTGTSAQMAPLHNLSQKWAASLYGDYGLKFQGGTPPVVSGGTVYSYALTDAVWDYETWTLVTPPQAYMVALSATSGAVKWVSARLQDEGGYGSHNGASVDPATGDVYAASWNSLYRISGADGSIVWQHTTPGDYGANAVVNGAPALGNNKAYWMTQGGGGHLVGVNMNAGIGGAVVSASVNVAMPTDVNGSSFGTPVAFKIGGTNYVGMNYGRAYGSPMGGGVMVVDADSGAVLWSKWQAELPSGATADEKAAYCFTGSMSYRDGVLYARSYDDQMGHTNNGTLWALDAATGGVVWQTVDQDADPEVFDNVVNGHGAPIASGGVVVVGGGTAYYGGAGQKVQAFSAASGERLWEVAGIGGWGNQIALAGQWVYAGSEDLNLLSVLDAQTGRVVTQYSGAGSSPAIAGGLVYTVDADGRMVAIGGSLPGDADNNGTVDAGDYALWFNHYGTCGAWEDGDVNSDGTIDASDYAIWFNAYGSGGSGLPAPEPATLTLCLLGAAALLRRRK